MIACDIHLALLHVFMCPVLITMRGSQRNFEQRT